MSDTLPPIIPYRRPLKQSVLRVVTAFFLPLVVFYYEIVFNLLTVSTIFSLRFLFIFLFSLSFGGIGILISRIAKRTKVTQIIKSVMIPFTALPYIIEYFVYRQFKVFYDVTTVTVGAGDAVGGFMDAIITLVFSFGGLLSIVLFLAPAFIYFFLLRRYEPKEPMTWHNRIIIALAALFTFLLSMTLILTNDAHWPVYFTQYNFQSAVSDFGLLTGIRKDIQHVISGDDSVDFENTEQIVLETTTAEPVTAPVDNNQSEQTSEEETVETTTEYGYNELDIDFEALAASSSGTVAKLDQYVASLTASRKNKYTGLFAGKNLIFLTAEAFTAEVIDPELTPTLYRLATKGINFTDYYQPASAGTTGGEYQNIFGMLPTKGGSSVKATAEYNNYYTMGSQLNRLGYKGWAFHNNDYKFYSRHLTHNNLGYSEGFMGYGNGMEEYVTNQWPQSDLEMIQGTLPLYMNIQPFNVYYMTVSGHSDYTRGSNRMTQKHWDRVAHLNCSDRVKGYLAANLDLEDALTYLVDTLEANGIADDTVIVLATDHFPYGLDEDGSLGKMQYLEELYGYNPTTYFQRDHNRLIIWSGCLEEKDPIIMDAPTSSMDILPTLSNLFGTEFDSRLMPGRDVFSDAMPLVFNTGYEWKTELGTYYGGKFRPVSEDTEIPEGYVKAVNAIVKNKMTYCKGVLDTDYFRHVFGDPEE